MSSIQHSTSGIGLGNIINGVNNNNNNINSSINNINQQSTGSNTEDSLSSIDRIKKKRNRTHKSCLPCAKAKRKCCKQQPCTNCKIRNLECVYDKPVVKLQRKKSNTHPNIAEAMGISSVINGESVKKEPHVATATASPESMSTVGSSDDAGSVTSATSVSSGNNAPNNLGTCESIEVGFDGKKTMSIHGTMLGSSSNDSDGKMDFVLRIGESNQRTVSRYYGPSSGPSLLLCRGPYSFSDADCTPFPTNSIPDLELILQAYYDKLHWYIGCFEWEELLHSLKSDNVSCINSSLYMVISLGCFILGREAESKKYEEISFNLCSDILAGNRLEYSDGLLVLHLLRVHACDISGKFEEAWAKLGMAITIATGMGYHRKWPFPYKGEVVDAKKQATRSRIWYSFLITERKLALLLGRPYMIRSEFYDCELPSNSGEFNYETTFRDALNKMVPLYTTLIDEVHKSEPSNAKILELDQRVSQWTFSQGEELSYSFNMDEYESPYKQVIIMQRIYILVIKNFFKSRMHRLFLTSKNDTHRMYSTEQYFYSNAEFCNQATELMKYDRSFGLTDLVTFLVDNALFYSIKLATTEQFILCGDCAKQTAEKFRYLLDKAVSDEYTGNTSSARIARSGLQIVKTLESNYNKPAGSKPSPDDTVESLKKASKLPHPYEDQAATPTSAQFQKSVSTEKQQQTELRINDIFNRPPLSFDLSDWDNWLQEFPLDQYWTQI